MDFMSDWVVGPTRKQIRIINVMDEGSRRVLWTEAHESISAKKLVEILDQIIEYRGAPAYICCDNSPEFISVRLDQWAEKNKIEIRFSQLGKPSQNGLVERLNKTVRKECLNLTKPSPTSLSTLFPVHLSTFWAFPLLLYQLPKANPTDHLKTR